MTAEEYEAYVAELVSQLDVFSSATISRNKEFDGVRQPGKYEIDIAVEFLLGVALRFLLIIECKNWSRPIDRPIVQKLIQTRDAVSAHKAALVSPVGFTKEAIEVAKAQGIALWVIAEKVWEHVSYYRTIRSIPITFRELRLSCLKYIGYVPRKMRACTLIQQGESGSRWHNLPHGGRIRFGTGSLSIERFETHLPRNPSFELPSDIRYTDSIPRVKDELAALNGRTAVSDICALLLDQLSQADYLDSESNPIEQWKKDERERLEKYGLESEAIERLLSAVISDAYSDFETNLKRAWDTRKPK